MRDSEIADEGDGPWSDLRLALSLLPEFKDSYQERIYHIFVYSSDHTSIGWMAPAIP